MFSLFPLSTVIYADGSSTSSFSTFFTSLTVKLNFPFSFFIEAFLSPFLILSITSPIRFSALLISMSASSSSILSISISVSSFSGSSVTFSISLDCTFSSVLAFLSFLSAKTLNANPIQHRISAQEKIIITAFFIVVPSFSLGSVKPNYLFYLSSLLSSLLFSGNLNFFQKKQCPFLSSTNYSIPLSAKHACQVVDAYFLRTADNSSVPKAEQPNSS